MFDLKGKTALVTGSTQGIGLEIAKMLSSHGAKVFVCGASSIEKCAKACEEVPNSSPVRANLLNDEDIENLYKATGDVDILVLNASMQYNRAWDEYTTEEFDNIMDCNVRSSFMLMKLYSAGMKKKGWGRIVTIGSTNQHNNHPRLSMYGVSKAAQEKMVRNVAPALAPYGITVNNVAPGLIDTPRNAEALSDAEFTEKAKAKIPCGYIGTPEDISPITLLLCSEEGRYITGADIVVDGGMSL